jgi:hypothetical protein
VEGNHGRITAEYINAAKPLLLSTLRNISITTNNFTTSLPRTNITNKMPSNVLSTIAARAKAHHDSLNAAYSATYSPRVSTSTPISTPPNSRKSSTTSQSSESSQSDRNIRKLWKAIKKEHRDMNAACSAFYYPGYSTQSSRASSVAASPKMSVEQERSEEEAEPRNYQKAWGAVKNRVTEHHKSVGAANRAVYGA